MASAPLRKKKAKAASAAKKKTAATAATSKKKVTATKKPAPKKKVTKKATVATAKKKTTTAKKKKTTTTTAKKRASATTTPSSSIETPTTERSPVATPSNPDISEPTPSERVLATYGDPTPRDRPTPSERSLTDEEREAMTNISETARVFVGADGAPREIVTSIATFVEDVVHGRRDEPKSQDVRLGLGALWGEQLRAQMGWRWVYLAYPDGFKSYAIVPDDRAFVCFPLNRIPEALRGSTTNASAHVFESIRVGQLPTRKENAYLVIG